MCKNYPEILKKKKVIMGRANVIIDICVTINTLKSSLKTGRVQPDRTVSEIRMIIYRNSVCGKHGISIQ